MNKDPKKSAGASEATGKEASQPKIMTKPLPEILDELENYIKRVEEAVRLAQAAAKDSRAAADMAKEAGEKAAEAAKKAADAAVTKVREEAARAADALRDRIEEVHEHVCNLEEMVKQEAIAVDDAFLALKERHLEQSPFYQSK
jgi:uncharacterized coiled-coil DUF342 family protein